MVRRIPHLRSTRTRIYAPGPEGAPLTAADHTPADQAVAQRARTDDSPTASQVAGMGGRPGLRNQMLENPLLSLFGTILVVLLGFVLTTSNIWISETNDRITRLENRIDDRIDRLENRIGSLDRAVADIDRKLTALIAVLDKTEVVEDTLSGDVTSVGTPQLVGEAAGP